MTKLRHLSVESKFGQSLVEISTGLRHWGCRSLVSKFGRHLIDTLTLQCVPLIYRAHFDQTSTLGVSKFGRSFYPHSTKLRHWCLSLVEVSTKLRHRQICTISTKPYMYNYDPWIFIIYQIIFIAWIKQNTHFLSSYIHNFEQNLYIILINKYIHNLVQKIFTILTFK